MFGPPLQNRNMPLPNRPVVFIGSSVGGLPVAQALQLNLDRVAEVILWSQGVFGLSEGTLESLVGQVGNFDFAVLVLTPDDLTLSRGGESPSPRDNVLFELGLFMGGLGRSRTFIVYDRTAGLKLPSDLAGVTPATYQPPAAGSLQSALGAPSTSIQSAIENQGARLRAGSEQPIDSSTQFRVIAGLLGTQAIQFMILMHETGALLAREGPYTIGLRYEYSDEGGTSPSRGMGHGYFSVDQFCNRLADAGLMTIDLRGRVGLSERGNAFGEWLVASGYKVAYFWTDFGTWGERPIGWQSSEHAKDMPRNLFEMQDRIAEQEAKAGGTGAQQSGTNPG